MIPRMIHISMNTAQSAFASGDYPTSLVFAEIELCQSPNDPELLSIRADSLVMLRQFDEARAAYLELLQHVPDHMTAMVNLGCLYRANDDFAAAKQWFERAAAIDPHFRILIFARATMHIQLGENDEAMSLLEPLTEDVDAKFLLANLYLADGEYERGFHLYRSRGYSAWSQAERPVTGHHWTPFDHWTEATNKTVAVFHEGGAGDIIQLCRYLPLLADVARHVTYYVPQSLHRVLAGLPANVDVSSAFADFDPAQYDHVTTDLEMPYHFRTTLNTIPDRVPYLHVPPATLAEHRLPPTDKMRVGLCWAGGFTEGQPGHWSERRSFDLVQYAPLAAVPDVEFVSLQLGPRAEQTGVPVLRVLQPGFDYLDTAAIISQLQLVITVDTSIVHLAAALGTSVWLLSRLDACWRWLRNRPSNPWYPDVLRVFGQTAYRDWGQPIAEVTEALTTAAMLHRLRHPQSSAMHAAPR